MYPLIGIIMRDGLSEAGNNISYVYSDIEKAIINSGGIPIGINKKEISKYLDICDGFIMEGGDEFSTEDFHVIKQIKTKDKPLLGICLGMQEMAYQANGRIKDIPNHMNTTHEITINKDSLLYKIIGKEKITVNSRHKSAITNTNLFVSSYATDNVIESVEDKNNKFFLGVAWHPENMYDYDESAKKIFDYFIKICHHFK